MSLSARIKPAQFWSAFGHLLYGKCSVLVTTGSGRTRGVPRDVWKRGNLHGVPWRASGECLASSMESHGECVVENVAASMESHGERVVETWQLPWSLMYSSVLDAGLVE